MNRAPARARGPMPERGTGHTFTSGFRGRKPTPPALPRASELAELLQPGEEIVAGRRPVEEAFRARREALRLLIVPHRRQALDALVLHATTLRIPVVEVEGGTLTALTGFDGHQGVAVAVAPRSWATLEEVLARAAAAGEPPLLLVLDTLEDPQNVGTLLRSAEACGVHGVVFPRHRAAPLGPAAVKASAGAVEHLLLVPVDDLPGACVDLRGRGIRIVGADAEAPLGYRDADLRGPLALVVGSEGRGIDGAVRRRIDLLVSIPMRGQVQSLNASVAGSVLLFEAASQRASAAPRAMGPGSAPSLPGGEAAAPSGADADAGDAEHLPVTDGSFGVDQAAAEPAGPAAVDGPPGIEQAGGGTDGPPAADASSGRAPSAGDADDLPAADASSGTVASAGDADDLLPDR